MTLVLIAILHATAGTFSTCAATETSASTNARWQILTEMDQDGRRDGRAGTTASASAAAAHFGGSREVELCTSRDSMGGITLRGTTDMIEVALPGRGQPTTCTARASAEGDGEGGGTAWVGARDVRGGANGTAWARAATENAAEIGVDAGGGGTFAGEWTWRVAGPNTRWSGAVEISELEGYAGGALDIPGYAHVEVWDGAVDAWVRQGDAYVHYVGPAPVRLAVDVVVPGRGGRICGTGGASAGVGTSGEDGSDFTGASGVQFTLAPSATNAPAHSVPTVSPTFLPCTCD